jgi:hypothetical protein
LLGADPSALLGAARDVEVEVSLKKKRALA